MVKFWNLARILFYRQEYACMRIETTKRVKSRKCCGKRSNFDPEVETLTKTPRINMMLDAGERGRKRARKRERESERASERERER